MTVETAFYIDRFEDGQAVLLAGERVINIPRELLPPGAGEGDWLLVSIALDKQARKQTAAEISELQRRLASADNGESQ